MNVRHPWLFQALSRPHIKPMVPDRAYYWLLDRLSDNNGWRPLNDREKRR
jgi:hypothetical protein